MSDVSREKPVNNGGDKLLFIAEEAKRAESITRLNKLHKLLLCKTN